MKVKPPRKDSWLEIHLQQLRKQQGSITRLQGNPSSRLFLIAPVPTQQELGNNLAWCDWSARRFFTWTTNQHSLGPDDFLIMPTTFDGKKPVKANTSIGQDIVASAARSSQVSHFICVGSDAFKVYMGFGKKPSMSSLVGNIMYLAVVNHKPVFVFPDIGPLRYDPDFKFKDKREWFLAKMFCEQKMAEVEKTSEYFAQFLKSRKVNK